MHAKRRLADEYDAAQAAGEVANSGDTLRRGPGVPDQNAGKPTAADIGLSRKAIHEARQIRDAEKAEPGIAPDARGAITLFFARVLRKLFVRRLLLCSDTA